VFFTCIIQKYYSIYLHGNEVSSLAHLNLLYTTVSRIKMCAPDDETETLKLKTAQETQKSLSVLQRVKLLGALSLV
jgi:hypothetical protein